MIPRLLIVAPSAYGLGGLATWLSYLEPGLQERGWHVTLGLVQGPRHHLPTQYVAENPSQNWVPIPCLTGTPEGRCQALMRAIGKERPHLVAGVNVPDVYSAVARLRSRGHGPRAVMTIHGIQSDLLEDVKRCETVLDGVICTNRLAHRLVLKEAGLSRERVHYAGYGVAIEPYRRPQASRGLLKIAWIGRLEQSDKRVHDIPPILHHLRHHEVPFQLLIAGAGSEEERLQRELRRFTEANQVKFLGRVDAQELRIIYAQANALLLTSAHETGPQVVWEAMASSLPVVSSRYVGSGLESALKDGRNALLFPVGDSRAAALQLCRLWREPLLNHRIASNAHWMVSERYSIMASLQSWDTALRESMWSGPRRARTELEVPHSQGRMDAWLGISAAEGIRRLMRRRVHPQGGPGSEWPHSYGRQTSKQFLEIARKEDQAFQEGLATEPAVTAIAR